LGLYLFSYLLSKNKIISIVSVTAGMFLLTGYGPNLLNDFSPKAFILVLFPYIVLFIYQSIIQRKEKIIAMSTKQTIKLLLFVVMIFCIFGLSLYLTYGSFSLSLPYFSLPLVDNIGIIIFFFIIFSLILMKYIFKNKVHTEISFFLFIFLVLLLFIHIPMGIFGSLFVLLYFTFIVFIIKYPKITNLILYFTIIFAISFFILQAIGILKFQSFLFSFYNVSSPVDGFQNMSNHINYIYSLGLFFFLIGSGIIIFCKKTEYYSALFLTSFILIILLAPIATVWRVLVFLNPFMLFFISYGVVETVKIIFNRKRKNYSLIFINCLFIILFLTMVATTTNEIDYYISPTHGFSSVGKELYSAGEFLKENTSKHTLLLQYKKTSNSILRIGHYAGKITYETQITEPPDCVKEIFTSETSNISYNKIQNLLKNNSIDCEYYLGGASPSQYIYRSQRIKKLINEILSKQIYFVIIIDRETLSKAPYGFINKFYDTNYFTLLYNDTVNQIYIFGVNPEPGVPFKIQNNTK